MAKLPVILYTYDASPFGTKVKHMLTLKRIPYKRVDVGMMLPRPELSELLGITYRQIPVLAIGNDVYCDSSLIASVLETRFPASDGYGTLFPRRKGGGKADTGLVEAWSVYYAGKVLFPFGAQSLPYARLGEKFIADRSAWQGGPIDIKGLAEKQNLRTSALASHLELMEEQLSDDREWLLDTETPSLADVAAFFVLPWLKGFRNLKEAFDPSSVPKTIAYLDRIGKFLTDTQKSGAAPSEKVSAEDAARTIFSSAQVDSESLVGFASNDAARLGLKEGESVAVTPVDSGKVPTVGTLLALSAKESVIEVKGKAGTLRCHFPRLGFGITPTPSAATAKL